ncbi:MAG: ABC transporter substrate-binding protein [Ruminococcus sp.]|nr:ABC transporter substrate-binding protein [Oscillospiraceae bacterium]MDY4413945.1 ABC transporter substrate-binding protein [Ruminococcus sp.]
MNKLKRTLALMATLAMATTAFVGCGSDETSSSSSSSSAPESSAESSEESSAAESSAAESSDASSEESSEAAPAGTASEEVGAVTLATGGDNFVVSSWNADDAEAMISQWEATTGKKATFDNLACAGGEASEKFNNKFQAGDDLDLYFVEADWALMFINDDEKTAPLESLGFTDANFADIYAYTDEIGKSSSGVRKGVSWQAAAGGFAYRTDLAEQYLGVKSPEEMQAKVGDWDSFKAAAKTVSEQSGGKTALADTLGGLWQVFAAGRTQPWVDSNNTLQVDDSCKEFADLAKELWDEGAVMQVDQWSPDWLPAGQTDSVMGYFVSTWGFGDTILCGAAGGEGGATYGKWNVCVGPQEYFWGGTWMVVNPKTDNGEECQSFIKTFTVDDASIKEYALNKPEYCNNMTVMADIVSNPDYKDTYVLNNLGGQNYFEVLDQSVKGVNLNGLITPYDATIKSKFLETVKESYVKGGKSWDETVEDFKDAVSVELEDVTVE